MRRQLRATWFVDFGASRTIRLACDLNAERSKKKQKKTLPL